MSNEEIMQSQAEFMRSVDGPQYLKSVGAWLVSASVFCLPACAGCGCDGRAVMTTLRLYRFYRRGGLPIKAAAIKAIKVAWRPYG